MDEEAGSDLLIQVNEAYHRVVADPEGAGPTVHLLIVEARRIGDRRALVGALRAAGWYERSRLAHDRAAVLLDEAVRTARRHALQPEWRRALVTRGAVRHEQGRLTAALRDFSRAASFLGDEVDPELDFQLATLHQNTGRLAAAAAVYRRILSSETSHELRGKAANNLGVIEVQCGRVESGLALLEIAVHEVEHVGPGLSAFIAETRAWATVRAGRLTEGMELFDDAALRWAAVGIPLGELYTEYAEALTDLRLIPEARREASHAVDLLERSGVALMAAEALVRSAQLALLSDDLAAAGRQAERAADLLGRQRRASWAARARVIGVDARLAGGVAGPSDLAIIRRAAARLEHAGMIAEAVDAHVSAGRVATTLGRLRLAREHWGRAAALARGAPLLVRLKGRLAGALSAATDGRHGDVVVHSRAGLADLASHRAALASTELRALASGHGAELGRIGLTAVAASRPAADVLSWMERTRAAALTVVDPPEIDGIEELLGVLRVLQGDIAALRREGGAGLGELQARQAAIEEAIRRAAWRQRVGHDSVDGPLPIAELRRRLDGRALVAYDVLGADVVAVTLTRRAARLVPLGPVAVVQRELDALGLALRRLARGGDQHAAVFREVAEEGLSSLRQLLVTPLGLGRPGEVVVVPVGVLQRVPSTALHDEPVSVAPSASMWARTASRVPASQRVVLIAGPDLPGAVAEVEALAALHPTAEVLVPPDSDVAAVLVALADASLAHVACHGLVRADNPIFSSVLVSRGHLSVHELDRRGIAPHRMILAACESGSDGAYPGNETLGFVSTLLALGTSGLLASSVVVPDWDVIDLMTALHEALLSGASMSVALHTARATIERDDPARFVSWCAFDAFGAA